MCYVVRRMQKSLLIRWQVIADLTSKKIQRTSTPVWFLPGVDAHTAAGFSARPFPCDSCSGWILTCALFPEDRRQLGTNSNLGRADVAKRGAGVGHLQDFSLLLSSAKLPVQEGILTLKSLTDSVCETVWFAIWCCRLVGYDIIVNIMVDIIDLWYRYHRFSTMISKFRFHDMIWSLISYMILTRNMILANP
jgi:hypothetical protein